MESFPVAAEYLNPIRWQRQHQSSSTVPLYIDLMPELIAILMMGDAGHRSNLAGRNGATEEQSQTAFSLAVFDRSSVA